MTLREFAEKYGFELLSVPEEPRLPGFYDELYVPDDRAGYISEWLDGLMLYHVTGQTEAHIFDPTDPVQAAEAARRIGISDWHIYKQFAEPTGASIGEWLLPKVPDFPILVCATLLKHTEFNIEHNPRSAGTLNFRQLDLHRQRADVYCTRCGGEIPTEKEIRALRDLVNKAGKLVLQGFISEASKFLEPVGRFCITKVYPSRQCVGLDQLQTHRDVTDMFSRHIVIGDAALADEPDCEDNEKDCEESRRAKRIKESWLERHLPSDPSELQRVREFQAAHPTLKPPQSTNVAKGASDKRGYRILVKKVSEAKVKAEGGNGDKSVLTKPLACNDRHVPDWGQDRDAVFHLLSYLDPYSENQHKKDRFQCACDAISHLWWNEYLPDESPLRQMNANCVDKLMFDIKKKGDEILISSPHEGGWELKEQGRIRINQRFTNYLNRSGKLGRIMLGDQVVGYLIAYMPAPYPVCEWEFISFVKRALRGAGLDSQFPDDCYTEDIIARSLRRIITKHLSTIKDIGQRAIENPLLVSITPYEIVSFLKEHPEMMHDYIDYETKVSAELEQLDPDEGGFWDLYWDCESFNPDAES